ncbi:MAG: hypothetical protein ACRESW_11775 [Nevskiales bacterium]
MRHTSSNTALGQVTTTLTVGTAPNNQAVFKSTATDKPVDAVPNAFKFTDKTNVAHGVVLTSNAVTVTGFNTSVPVSVAGGTYSIGCTGVFKNTAGTISPAEKVCVRHTSASLPGTWRDTTLTIGGVMDTFSSTTVNGPPNTSP